MSNPQILNEYLVRLGFEPDRVGYARFTNALRDVEGQVNNRYWNMAKRVGEFEAATLGAFAAIGVGTLGFMDRVAMADQSYRLFALRMYTSLPVARELKVALDALGQPLENVMWDPELAERFHQLVKDQQILAEQLGPNFEKNMMAIRDARFEVTRFGVELKYLGMNVVNDLFKAFGKGGDDLEANLKHFNDWFIANIPFFAYWITANLLPALKNIGEAFKTIFDEVKQVNWQTVANAVNILVKALAQASELMTHLVAGSVDMSQGNFGAARKEMGLAGQKLNPASGAALGAAIGAGSGIPFGAPVGAGIGYVSGVVAEDLRTSTADRYRQWAHYVGKKLGIPDDVILSQWSFETGGFSTVKGNNLAGIKTPSGELQKFLSLKDFSDRDVAILRNYIARSGGVAPQTVQDFAQMLATAGPQGKPYSDKTASQYAAGMNVYITVNAKTDATAEDIARKIDQVLQESLRRPPKSESLQIQRNINEVSVSGWAQP